MNKKEFIETLMDMRGFGTKPTFWASGWDDAISDVIRIAEELDEPKVEENFYTFDNAKKWLEDNGFVVFEKDKLDTEVQRMVDETYEETNEKPTIPDFMAYWIEENECLSLMYIGFELFSNTIKDKNVNDWISNNQEQFCRAFVAWPNVEVEKEKRYRVVLPFTVWDEHASKLNETTMFLAFNVTSDETRFSTSAGKSGDYRTDLTESQIKAIDKRYWAFAEEVTE